LNLASYGCRLVAVVTSKELLVVRLGCGAKKEPGHLPPRHQRHGDRAAALFVVGALVGLFAAFVAAFAEYYVGGPSFGQCFFWECLLPLAAALLFVAAYRQRSGRPAMW
jgi:hypothetical protein